jgi:N-acetylglutamate synthase-like GNAT family acetyltransferase
MNHFALKSGRLFSKTYILNNIEIQIKNLENEGYKLIERDELWSNDDLYDECQYLTSIPRYILTDPSKSGFLEDELPFMAILKNGSIISCIWAYVLEENVSPDENIIHFSIGVNKEHRKKGISKWLIYSLILHAKENYIKIIYADVINKNLEAYLKTIGFSYMDCNECIGKGMILDLDPNYEWDYF